MAAIKPKVKLLAHTSNPENLIANSARLCYANNKKLRDIIDGEKINQRDDARMVGALIKINHMSPLEHASYTFFIEGVSRAMTHQLVRHRIASYSQRSQRYVEHSDFDFIIPNTINEAGLTEKYSKMMSVIGSFYKDLKKSLESKLEISGELVNQDARYILPNACETKINVTMNSRALLNFFNLRLCNRAQWEIRDVAEKMLDLVYPTAPNIFQFAGPDCYINGKCSQGKMSCGKSEEVIKKFSLKKQKFLGS